MPSQVALRELRSGEYLCSAYMFAFEQAGTLIPGNKIVCGTSLTNCDQEIVVRVKRLFRNQCSGFDNRCQAPHSIDDQSYSVRLQIWLQMGITRDSPNFFELFLRGEKLEVSGEPGLEDEIRRIVRRNERRDQNVCIQNDFHRG